LVLFWLRLLVGSGVLGVIISRIDLGAATVRPSPRLLAAVAAATGLLIVSQAVAALRWKTILGDGLLPWSYLLRLYIIGSFFGLFLPTSVGGDAVRAVAAARSSERRGRAMASVLIDRGFGVMATLAYAALGLILAPDSIAMLNREAVSWHAPGLAGAGLTFLAIGVAVPVLSRSAKVLTVWRDGAAALTDLMRSPGRLGRVSALAVLSQGLIVLLWYTLAHGVSLTLPFSTFLWAVPVVSLSAMLPVTLSGLGVREGVWLVLLASSPIPPADIVVFSLLYFACTLLVGITGGLLFVSSGTAFARADGASS
jgi:glycosyltransferase 2 family protein